MTGGDHLSRRRFVAVGAAVAAGTLTGRVTARAGSQTRAEGSAATQAAQFVTEPSWNLIPVTIGTPATDTAPGWIFLAPFGIGVTEVPPGQYGPTIVDNNGDPIWFLPLETVVAQDFRVQTYRGSNVLTWYEGPAGDTYGGTCVIYDSAYRELKRVRAGHRYSCDMHEFLITSRGTALLSIYNEVTTDLSSIGGPTRGLVVEGIVQEIDIDSQRVLFEWHSLDHVGLDESYRTDVTSAGNIDYFHLNSIGVDTDGQLLISARFTSTVYKLNRKTGAVIWRLGGMKNDFQMGPGASFNFQHDARRHADGTLTLFDNGASGTGTEDVEPASRPLRLSLDLGAMTAELVQLYETPDSRLATSLGNVQELPNTNVFVGWGAAGAFSEFSVDGSVVLDATIGDGDVSYRAFRLPWVGQPTTDPTVAAVNNSDGTMTVYASWNGSTEVMQWQVKTGDTPTLLATVATAARTGFETAITVPAAAYVSVTALDAAGSQLGASHPLDAGF
jgi:hypothetical protein